MKTKLSNIALAALLFAGLPLASSSAHVGISIGIAPPAIPIYEQPYSPGLGYIWTPGYWDYADFGYYWVPGVWVRPPRVGFLWTPGYWGYQNGLYGFNDGYWGSSVGFYGGINYGFGYGGSGYYGGRWSGDRFLYNTAVSRVNTTVINNNYTYSNQVQPTGSRAGFNGPGGAKAQATAQEQAVAKASHLPPTQTQRARVQAAKNDPALRVKNNQGKPKAEAIAALNNKTGANQAAANAGNANAKNNQKGAPTQNANARQANAGANEKNTAKRAVAADQNNAKAARAERSARPETKTRPAARAARVADRPEPRVRHAAQPQRSHQTRPVASVSHANRRPPTMAHQGRPQMAQHQGPANRRPANASQQAKKKKRGQQGPGQ